MTTLAFHIGRALGRRWGSGDEIVVTELDHLANVAPWQAIADERGVTIRTAPMLPESCTLDWAALEQLVTGQTRLLAIGAASNAVGTISDLDRAAKLARKAGALLFVDAVHFAPHELVNVSHIDCDFLACSAHKFYGPHIGALYARREVASELDVARVECAPNTVPERLETGTLNHEGMTPEEVDAAKEEIGQRFGLPVCDPLLDGMDAVVQVLETRLVEREAAS